MIRAKIFQGDPTKTEDYQLERRATELKRAGDMPGAIECLRQAESIRGVLRSETRLAKYLQEAGLFDDAMFEIKQMIGQSHTWAEGNFWHKPRSVRRCQQASRLARLHDDAALLCKREGAHERCVHHEQEALRWWELHKKLKPLADRDKKHRRDSLDREKE